MEVGSVPNSHLVEGLAELNEEKEIKVNCWTDRLSKFL